jgi:hypothetical protein
MDYLAGDVCVHSTVSSACNYLKWLDGGPERSYGALVLYSFICHYVSG